MSLFSLAAAALAVASASAQSSLTLDFDGSRPLHTVSSRYVAFNIDTGSLYNGFNFSDTVLRTLVKQLTLGAGSSIIRIGGTAVDSSFYEPGRRTL